MSEIDIKIFSKLIKRIKFSIIKKSIMILVYLTIIYPVSNKIGSLELGALFNLINWSVMVFISILILMEFINIFIMISLSFVYYFFGGECVEEYFSWYYSSSISKTRRKGNDTNISRRE